MSDLYNVKKPAEEKRLATQAVNEKRALLLYLGCKCSDFNRLQLAPYQSAIKYFARNLCDDRGRCSGDDSGTECSVSAASDGRGDGGRVGGIGGGVGDGGGRGVGGSGAVRCGGGDSGRSSLGGACTAGGGRDDGRGVCGGGGSGGDGGGTFSGSVRSEVGGDGRVGRVDGCELERGDGGGVSGVGMQVEDFEDDHAQGVGGVCGDGGSGSASVGFDRGGGGVSSDGVGRDCGGVGLLRSSSPCFSKSRERERER